MSTRQFPANTVLITSTVNESAKVNYGDDEQCLLALVHCQENDHGVVVVDMGRFFRGLMSEYGRCISRIYEGSEGETVNTGWVFERRVSYEEYKGSYLQHTWVRFAVVTPRVYTPVGLG